MDKPTGRVVALIVLLVVVAAALRGYLPAPDHPPTAEPVGARAATTFVVGALAGTLTLLAAAVVARLRDPRAVAPSAAPTSEMLGTGRGRPSWRVLLVALAVIVAWLLVAMLLTRLWAPHNFIPSIPASQSPAPPPAQTPAPGPQQRPRNDDGDMLRVLLAGAGPMLVLLVAGSVMMSRRRPRAYAPGDVPGDDAESPAPAPPSESLARAAELGLAEMTDPNRDPREAIIACYAAMERELTHVPEAVPQECDTPTEVLARAVEHHALHADNAAQLVALFTEARFSPHVMAERHRDAAVRLLRLVLDELGARSAA